MGQQKIIMVEAGAAGLSVAATLRAEDYEEPRDISQKVFANNQDEKQLKRHSHETPKSFVHPWKLRVR